MPDHQHAFRRPFRLSLLLMPVTVMRVGEMLMRVGQRIVMMHVSVPGPEHHGHRMLVEVMPVMLVFMLMIDRYM